jgi:tellurite resistance protein TerC
MEWLALEWIGKPIWMWTAFLTIVVALLAFDLGVLNKQDKELGIAESLKLSAFYITIAMLYGGAIWWAYEAGHIATSDGTHAGLTYFTGFFIEKALSIDNVFVFALIFTYFAVPERYQHKVLFWGVIGALLFRLVFIFVGAELLKTFFWTAYLFGAFLVYTAYKMAFHHDRDMDPERNLLVRMVKRVVPTISEYDEGRFFTRRDGTRVATLLFVVLVAVEATDLIFAIDSVAAVLAITTSTFIVWTANAFAVLGLRSLYFCLAGLMRRFVYLHYGLAVLLGLAGVKLILSETPVGKLPIPLTLGAIVVTLGVSIAWSLLATKGQPRTALPGHDTGHDAHTTSEVGK